VRLLLVDDHEAFAVSAAQLLSADERIEVVGIARDGDEAVELTEQLEPDLVLMDIAMPRVDGVSATRTIRERCPDVRVVMLTGRSGREAEEWSTLAGAIGYLRKEQLTSPQLADELLALVELS
jgi:DNA-binding NarL/FixJ family response regulator